MRFIRTLRRRKIRAFTLAVTMGALLVVAGSLAGASAAGGTAAASASAAVNGYPAAAPNAPWAWQKFLALHQSDVDQLSSMGIDVTEGTTKNPDGSAWISVLVTPAQRDYLEALGYRAGDIVETEAHAEAAQREMIQVGMATQASLRAAKTGIPAKHKRFLATETLKVTRADYFQSLSGTWLSVEAKSSAAQGSCQVNPTSANCGGSNSAGTDPCLGNPAGGASAATTAACPQLTALISTDGGATYHAGAQSTMMAMVDDDTYLYHRLLIRLSNAAGNATAPTLPIRVRVASNYGSIAFRDATAFTDTPDSFGPTFQHDFFNRYQTPEDGKAYIEALAAAHPDIAHIIVSPYSSGGYMRPAQAAIGCSVATVGGNSSIGAPSPVGGSPPGFATPSSCSTAQQALAVMLESKQMGNENGVDEGNAITFQIVDPSPLAPNLPLTVSVVGKAITVTRATNAAGVVDTTTTTGPNTAAKVVTAVNANPDAAALVKARRYQEGYSTGTGGNAGNSVVGVNPSPVPLSDALFAPQPGNPAFPAGFEPARAPFQFEFLRICKVCDGSKPGFYVFAEHHAREWVAPLVALETAGRLVNNYGTDPETTSFVDNLDIFVLPAENPDGSNYSLLQGGASQQRKNLARYCGTTPGNTTSTSWDMNSLRQANVGGVDNNRNYTVGSLFDGYEGASTSCTSETYSGPSEASEPETQNEFWLLNNHPNIRFSMNIHTYGGYFMWSPGAYKTVGRVALPYASKGWQEEFWATGRKVLSRIKQVRNTVVVPARTGPVTDVLYSAAGNESDEAWYNHNIVAYDFECGVQTYSATSTTSNTGSDVGFQPTFASEGRMEGQEFASGMYGLMSAALDYANDTTAPTVTPSVPSGTISQTPISLTLNESEPSDIYYTTDGSTPTLSSSQYGLSGFREQEGQTLTFTQNTTLKFFAVDPKGNTSSISTATYVVDSVAPVTTASFSPAAVGGWYTHPTVTLSATDDNSSVASTSYTLDGGSPTPYAAPLSGFSNGSHTLTFQSTDSAGNVEATNTVAFQVDSTAPTTTSSLAPAAATGSNGWYLGPVQVTLAATDTGGSGVASTTYSVDGGSNQAYSAPFTISADGSHTVTFFSTDTAGNAEGAHSITVKVDQNDPVTTASLSPAIHNGWYAGPTVTLSATDGSGSGVARIDYSLDGGPWGRYTAPLHITSNGNHMIQYRATDNAGRVEVVKLTAFEVDAVSPTVTISKPGDGNSYPQDKAVAASYRCKDDLSGLASCTGTVADGANIDTSTVGMHAFSVTATDNAGNTKTVTIHYQVTYTWNGFFAPVSNTEDSQLNLVHAGDLIKIGFGLNGNRGTTIFAAGFPTSVAISCPAWAPHTVPAGGAGTTPGLSYGVASGHYTFGWQTNAAWAGTCRRFEIQLNDGTPFLHTADFMFFS